MSAERDLAEAIYHTILSSESVDAAIHHWHDLGSETERARMWLVLARISSDAIDRVLARRPREAARAGPWEGSSQRGCCCPPTSEQTCKAPLCPRRGIGAAGFIGAARTGPWEGTP